MGPRSRAAATKGENAVFLALAGRWRHAERGKSGSPWKVWREVTVTHAHRSKGQAEAEVWRDMHVGTRCIAGQCGGAPGSDELIARSGPRAHTHGLTRSGPRTGHGR